MALVFVAAAALPAYADDAPKLDPWQRCVSSWVIGKARLPESQGPVR